MAKIKGVCHNYEGCDMASEKVVQEVEKSNFVCQECGKPLYPVKQQTQPWWKKHQRELTLGAGVLIIGGGITGGILAFGGDKEEPAKVQTEKVDSTKVDTVAQPGGGGGVNQPGGGGGVISPAVAVASISPAAATAEPLLRARTSAMASTRERWRTDSPTETASFITPPAIR